MCFCDAAAVWRILLFAWPLTPGSTRPCRYEPDARDQLCSSMFERETPPVWVWGCRTDDGRALSAAASRGDWCMCLCFSCFLLVSCGLWKLVFPFGILLNLLLVYKAGTFLREQAVKLSNSLTPLRRMSWCRRPTPPTESVCVPRLAAGHFLCKPQTLGIFYWMQ